MKAWVVGFLITMLLLRVIKIRISGFLVVVFLIVVPYFLGEVVLQILHVQ